MLVLYENSYIIRGALDDVAHGKTNCHSIALPLAKLGATTEYRAIF